MRSTIFHWDTFHAKDRRRLVGNKYRPHPYLPILAIKIH